MWWRREGGEGAEEGLEEEGGGLYMAAPTRRPPSEKEKGKALAKDQSDQDKPPKKRRNMGWENYIPDQQYLYPTYPSPQPSSPSPTPPPPLPPPPPPPPVTQQGVDMNAIYAILSNPTVVSELMNRGLLNPAIFGVNQTPLNNQIEITEVIDPFVQNPIQMQRNTSDQAYNIGQNFGIIIEENGSFVTIEEQLGTVSDQENSLVDGNGAIMRANMLIEALTEAPTILLNEGVEGEGFLSYDEVGSAEMRGIEGNRLEERQVELILLQEAHNTLESLVYTSSSDQDQQRKENVEESSQQLNGDLLKESKS